MNKSLYSLMLYDDIVRNIDRLAYSMNMNRSGLINQILAEHLSISIPAVRRRDIFDELTRFFLDNAMFKVQPSLTEGMLNVYSPLRYRYNPTVRYSVELYQTENDAFWELKVITRTQNADLIDKLNHFFQVYANTEKIYSNTAEYTISGGRFYRKNILPKNHQSFNSNEIANAISLYIQTLNGAIRAYFTYENEDEIQRIYKNYFDSAVLLL